MEQITYTEEKYDEKLAELTPALETEYDKGEE